MDRTPIATAVAAGSNTPYSQGEINVKWQIFDADGDYCDSREFDAPPNVGDEIDIAVDGKDSAFRVARVFRHFDRDNNVSFRIEVSFIGPNDYSAMLG